MDPAAVAAYYRAKGYVVRDGARVAGPSGAEHKVPLMAEGPLGSIAVFFGDFGGVDGPEMGGARKVAREVGATPVLAADAFSNQDRQLAARLGVVLIDAETLAGGAGPAAAPANLGLGADTGRAWPGLAPIPTRRAKEAEPEPHPWPASGRVGGRDGPATRAVDVDEILAAPAAPAADEASVAPPPGEAGPSGPPGADLAAGEGGGDRDGDGLWKRPRDRDAKPPRPRTPGSQRFAWLGADMPPAAARPGPAALAVEYDDVVPAKGAGADAAEDADDGERLGEAIELLPTLEEARRQEIRDRWMRRLFWMLFFAVVLYLVALWWF